MAGAFFAGAALVTVFLAVEAAFFVVATAFFATVAVVFLATLVAFLTGAALAGAAFFTVVFRVEVRAIGCRPSWAWGWRRWSPSGKRAVHVSWHGG